MTEGMLKTTKAPVVKMHKWEMAVKERSLPDNRRKAGGGGGGVKECCVERRGMAAREPPAEGKEPPVEAREPRAEAKEPRVEPRVLGTEAKEIFVEASEPRAIVRGWVGLSLGVVGRQESMSVALLAGRSSLFTARPFINSTFPSFLGVLPSPITAPFTVIAFNSFGPSRANSLSAMRG